MTDNNGLYHFGIRGQKWGIRRFQNEDGSLTAEGKRRYSSNTKGYIADLKNAQDETQKQYFSERVKENSRYDDYVIKTGGNGKRFNSLKNKYMKAGIPEREAGIKALNRIRAEKAIVIIGGIGIAAAAVYVAKSHYDDVTDVVIKKGVTIQSVNDKDAVDTDQNFYFSISDHDKKRYAGLYAKQILDSGRSDDIKAHQLTYDNDIKVISPKSMRRVYSERLSAMSSKDKTELHDVLSMYTFYHMNDKWYGSCRSLLDRLDYTGNYSNLSKDEGTVLNMLLVERDTGFAKGVFSAVKNMGYNAIKDLNDAEMSGYNTKTAHIMVNSPTGKVSQRHDHLDNDNIRRNGAIETAKVASRELVKKFAPVAAGGYLFKKTVGKLSKSARDSDMVDKYLEEHPNSKLTDREILDMLNRNQKKKAVNRK